MHARASTDEDLLPRLSQQQERLFSNLDGSMKHEAGSLYGSVALIAGAVRLAGSVMSWPIILVVPGHTHALPPHTHVSAED